MKGSKYLKRIPDFISDKIRLGLVGKVYVFLTWPCRCRGTEAKHFLNKWIKYTLSKGLSYEKVK